MHIVLGLIGSSIDGFVCGYLIKNLGVAFGKKKWINMFSVIMVCCFVAALGGRLLSYTEIEKYVDVLGVILMLCLAFSSFQGIYTQRENKSNLSVNLLALSLSADASIVCMYLGLEGANIFAIAIMSATLHCIFLAIGSRLSSLVTKTTIQLRAKVMAASVFLIIALIKLIGLF